MADLPYCPYCNLSAEARIQWMKDARAAERGKAAYPRRVGQA